MLLIVIYKAKVKHSKGQPILAFIFQHSISMTYTEC